MPLDHVALTVSDRDRSAAFYGEHFGLSTRVHDDEHLLIIRRRRRLAACPLRRRSGRRGPPPHHHFGFRLADRDAVLAARERFQAAGVTELEWQDHGPARVQVADPDGYRVEVYAF